MDEEYTKELIKQALWLAFTKTNNKDYYKLYQALYENFEIVEITGLEIK